MRGRISNLNQKQKAFLEYFQENYGKGMKISQVAYEMGEDIETTREIITKLHSNQLIHSTPSSGFYEYECSVDPDKNKVNSIWERSLEEKAKLKFIRVIGNAPVDKIRVNDKKENIELTYKQHLRVEHIDKLRDEGFIVEGALNSVEIPKKEL